ncbi:hypothetical protein FOZ63_011532 [Perkinsus olseni]|uniref:Uncharacterized protein n=1 Tax=Perkinsus olseni TaxID=32597 RepID=A0A7J6R3E9_PEROL|nr:hypothetical protein FOZ63_011532 [Perkinsus olseni]KAF4748760.1 hypothetical protein FOZ62_001562 [Perkinsus olseni]
MASTKVYDPENKVKCFAYEPNSNKLNAGFGLRSYGLHDLLPMKVDGDENLLASDLPEIKAWKFGNNSEPWYVKVHGDDIIEMDGEDPTKEAVWREVLGSDCKMHVMFGKIPRRQERDPPVPIIVVRRELSYFTSFTILRAVTGQERHGRLRDFKAFELRELEDDWTSVDLVTRTDEDFVQVASCK